MPDLALLHGALVKRNPYPDSFVSAADRLRYYVRSVLMEGESM